MAIEITEFADVSISVSPTGVASGNFGILGFLTPSTDPSNTSITPAERARAYTSLSSVATDWPTNSETYKAAQSFYGQTPTPKDFVVMMSYQAAQPATLVGGGSDSVQDIIAITSGNFVININGDDFNLTSIDLSSATDEDTIASAVTSLLDAVVSGTTLTWNGYQYVLDSSATGSGVTIGFATGDVAVALGLTQASAKISDGINAETATQSLAAIESMGIEYVA